MKQFDIERFNNLARWSLTTDRRWFVKTTWSWTVVLILSFLFFTCVVNFNNPVDGVRMYNACFAPVWAMVVVIGIVGPAMKPQWTRQDDLRQMVLPASNLEKYVMNYGYWLLLLPCMVVSLVVADGVQYLVNLLLGYEGTRSVILYMLQSVSDMEIPRGVPRSLLSLGFLHLFWLHSIFAIGAQFFRSHKWAWLLTTAALIVCGMFLGAVWPNDVIAARIDEQTALTVLRIGNVVQLLLIVLNFWLSYRLFCRRQLIGRFINI